MILDHWGQFNSLISLTKTKTPLCLIKGFLQLHVLFLCSFLFLSTSKSSNILRCGLTNKWGEKTCSVAAWSVRHNEARKQLIILQTERSGSGCVSFPPCLSCLGCIWWRWQHGESARTFQSLLWSLQSSQHLYWHLTDSFSQTHTHTHIQHSSPTLFHQKGQVSHRYLTSHLLSSPQGPTSLPRLEAGGC